MLIAPGLMNVATTPKAMDADGQLAGTPSVTCDAIAIVVTEEGAALEARTISEGGGEDRHLKKRWIR